MIKSIYRLCKPWEFTEVIEKGKKISNPEFAIFYSPSPLNNCRFGISIPRKLVKKATQRNYYKRQIKNILVKSKKTCQDLFFSHYDLVVIIRPGFLLTGQFSAKQKSLVELLSLIFPKESRLEQSTSKSAIYA